jgi:UDP-N-acetylmuramoylalanine--D-glutamate ligase
VLAITGTNGKTTTTAMTGAAGRARRPRVAVAGNIGPTMLDTLTALAARRDLPAGLGAGAVQLPARRRRAGGPLGFEPSAATVLNLTQDHLDWHGGMAAYAAAKARVFGQHRR